MCKSSLVKILVTCLCIIKTNDHGTFWPVTVSTYIQNNFKSTPVFYFNFKNWIYFKSLNWTYSKFLNWNFSKSTCFGYLFQILSLGTRSVLKIKQKKQKFLGAGEILASFPLFFFIVTDNRVIEILVRICPDLRNSVSFMLFFLSGYVSLKKSG